MVERMLADYAGAYDFRSISLRYFNAAGADPDDELGEVHDPEPHFIPTVLRVDRGLEPIVRINGGADAENGAALMAVAIPDYGYHDAEATWAHRYLLKPVLDALHTCARPPARVFELGCGNGWLSAQFAKDGHQVTGVDPSKTGVARARETFSSVRYEVASTEDDLAARFGQFEVVVSLEVIEHCYAPRQFLQCAHDLLVPGGTLILSTPFHGYWKNLALALTGRMERHFDPLWDGGHIKFFTLRSLTQLLHEIGFKEVTIKRMGRWPRAFAKSMLAIARR